MPAGNAAKTVMKAVVVENQPVFFLIARPNQVAQNRIEINNLCCYAADLNESSGNLSS